MVRAKFECESITETVGGKTYSFNAVRDSEENKAWAAATPFGKLQITINNAEAQRFSVGKSYYLDLLESQID